MLCVERVAGGRGSTESIVLINREGEEHALQGLHVRDVAAAADYGGWVVGGEGEEAMDSREASQRSIRSCSTLLVDVMLAVNRPEACLTKVIRRNDNTICELDTNDRCPGHRWVLSVLRWSGGNSVCVVRGWESLNYS